MPFKWQIRRAARLADAFIARHGAVIMDTGKDGVPRNLTEDNYEAKLAPMVNLMGIDLIVIPNLVEESGKLIVWSIAMGYNPAAIWGMMCKMGKLVDNAKPRTFSHMISLI